MNSKNTKKKSTLNRDQRRQRNQKIAFSIVAIIIIISWVLALVVQI